MEKWKPSGSHFIAFEVRTTVHIEVQDGHTWRKVAAGVETS